MTNGVRLVAGLCDGKVEKIDDEQNMIVMRERVPAPAAAVHRNFGIAGASSEYKQATYTRRVIGFGDGNKIVYFAPEGLSDFEALQTVLGP